MDIARGITRFTPAHVILVPTLAATNATISTLSVIYSDDGSVIEDYWRMDNAPDLTLVDTDILLRNSPQALTAGIADITRTYLEGLCNLELGNIRSEYPVFSYEGLQLALQIMHRCAPGAIQAVRNGQLNPDFENILSMIMHNCGPLWTACSMGLAHALDEVLLYFPQTHKQPHGLRVGFCKVFPCSPSPENALTRSRITRTFAPDLVFRQPCGTLVWRMFLPLFGKLRRSRPSVEGIRWSSFPIRSRSKKYCLTS